jgi:pimeloyl-ACP methyl ester carboxylesterase
MAELQADRLTVSGVIRMREFKALVALMSFIVISAAQAASATASATVGDGYAELPAGRIYYQDSGGTGAAVVFLHAGSGNSAVFENQIAPLLKAGYRYIAYDRAGQGKSTRADAAAATSTAPELEQLMDYLKIARFHIVGVAAGGGVGLQYALSRPQRVISITVSNSIGNLQDASYTEIGRRIRPAAFEALPTELKELGPSYRAANAAGVERWLLLNGRGGPPAGGPRGAPPGGGTAVTFAALEKFTVPTLLLTGDADMYTPPSVLRLFKSHMKQAQLAIIPESGHAAHWENPEAFNGRVIAFLREH